MTKRKVERVNAAVQVAKTLRGGISREPVQLASGYWAVVSPVSAPLIDEASSRVPEPEVPVVYIEDKGRSEQNPNDPKYLRDLERWEVDRSMAAVDAIIMMGVEIVNEDGTPYELSEDSRWYKKLMFLGKMGTISLDKYDLSDPFELEFAFKKYIAVSTSDIAMLTAISGLNAEEIDQAVKTFRSD